MNAFEAGTVVDWIEMTMANLMGLADEYGNRMADIEEEPVSGADVTARERAANDARDVLEDALRAALSAAPSTAGENAIQDIGDNLRDTLAPMEEPELVAQKIVQRGAIHALETLLLHGCTPQLASDMLASCRSNLLVIQAVGREKGFEAFTDPNGVNVTKGGSDAG